MEFFNWSRTRIPEAMKQVEHSREDLMHITDQQCC